MNRFIDIPGNGLGAHIVSQLVTSGFCHNFNEISLEPFSIQVFVSGPCCCSVC